MASEDFRANGHGGPATRMSKIMTKSELRNYFKKRRQDFVLQHNKSYITQTVERLGQRLDAAQIVTGTIAGYAAMRAELDPQALLRHWEMKGSCIVLPWFAYRESAMQFKSADAPLVRGPFAIAQPGTNAPLVEPDTLFVPLVAVDRHGNRLGQGQSHFDRALAQMREQRPVVAIGLAWECQLAESLPADPWDQPLDYIATPERLIQVTS